MTILKTFGYGNSSPYRSATFNKNNDLIFGKNGLIEIKSIKNSGVNVVLEDITFVQEGVIVQKSGSASVTFPVGLPSPFYLTATIPDTRPTDNISWGFVRRPQDIGENAVLLAEWDGQEWRPLSKMTFKSILEERLKAALAYNNVGFNLGFRFRPNPSFTTYTLTEGILTDQAGQLTEKKEETTFSAIGDDLNWNRIDVIAYRRLKDSPNRIGQFILRPGNTFSGANISQLYNTSIGPATEVKSSPKVVTLSDNSFILFYIEDYGANGKIVATKYADDRSVELIAPTTLVSGIQEFDVELDKDENIILVFTQLGNIFRMKLSSTLSVLLTASVIETLTNPCSKPVVKTDFLGNYYVMFLYQNTPTTYLPYFIKMNAGGSVSTPAKPTVGINKEFISVDFTVDQDFIIHAVYSNNSDKTVEYHKLNEIGDQLDSRQIISDDVGHNGVALSFSYMRNAKMHFTENHELYVTWEQSKTLSQWGLVFYNPSYKKRFGFKAVMKDITSIPTENVIDHAVSVDWNNHAALLVSIDGTGYYHNFYLPELGSRLTLPFETGLNLKPGMALEFDRKGSLIVSYADQSSSLVPNGLPLTTGLFGSGTYGAENVFVSADEIAFPLSSLSTLLEIPTYGDEVTVDMSTSGNNGVFTITSQRDAQINGNTHRIYRFSSATFTSESASGVQVQFERLSGNNLIFVKQTPTIEYNYSEVKAELVDTDIIAVMINTIDNSFLAWYQQTSTSGDDPTLRGETFLTCDGNVEWDKDLNSGTLTWSQPIRIVDPYRNEFIIPADSKNFIQEDDVLYVIYPVTEYLTEDGETEGPGVLSVVDVSQFFVGQEVFVGDSDSEGVVTNVTNVEAGKITVGAPVDYFTKIRGAYILPRTVTLLKQKRNSGQLKPDSLGSVDTRVYTVAIRKNDMLNFRNGALSLEHGEVGNIGDGTPQNLIDYIGAANEADSSPDYTNALGTPVANVVLVDGESLTKAVKRLETKSDTATVDYVDISSTSLPTGSTYSADGIPLVNGEKVLFTSPGIEGIYEISGVGSSISWNALNLFNGSVSPTNGALVKVTKGSTSYFKTIWERRVDIWKPTDVSDATTDPTGFRFEDLSKSTWYFDDVTRTFSITPTLGYFDIFSKGRVIRKIATDSITLPNSTDFYYIYYDEGTLQQSNVFDITIITEKIYVAGIYYNAEDGKSYLWAEERHGISMDHATHAYLHLTRGAVLSSGFSLGAFNLIGDGSSDTHVKFSIVGGTLHDEDLQHKIVHSASPTAWWQQTLEPYAKCPIYYRIGTQGHYRAYNSTDLAIKLGAVRPVLNTYNTLTSEWEVADVTADGKFFSMWVFVTNHVKEPVILLMGQKQFDSLEEAQTNEQYSDIVLGDFPFKEFKALHRFVFEADSTFTNSVKGALRYAEDLRISQDAPFPTTSISDHGQLTGLMDPDHPPTAVTTEGAEKDGGLSSSDIDLKDVMNMMNRFFGQLRLKEHPTNKKRVIVTGANRLLNDGTIFGQTISGYMMKFEGAEIDFSTGSIYAADGVTALGEDFIPEPTALNNFRWYSVAITLKEEPTEDLQADAIIKIRPASNIGLTPGLAEKALWGTGTPIGQVVVKGAVTGVDDISQSDIFWLGLGSGGGSGTSGGGGVGAGASYKNRAYGYSDGSQEEYNMQPPVYNASSDATEVLLDFTISEGEVVRVHVGGQNYNQYISDFVTPNYYWRMLAPQLMEIKGNIPALTPAVPISIEVLEGVEVAPVPPAYLAGLEVIQEAYCYTDGIGGSLGISNITVVSGKTRIVLAEPIKQEQVVNVFVDNKYFPPRVEGLLESNCYTQVDFQTIEIDSDYSGTHLPIYIAIYEGKSHVDEMGNVIITLRPTIDQLILRSPNSTKWKVFASNDGQLIVETISVGTPDPVHLYNEDDILCQLLIDNEGNIYTETPPVTPGIVFEQIRLGAENGLAWQLHVLGATPAETAGVVQLRDAIGNKWKLLNQLGEVIYQVSQTANGAIIDTQYIEDDELTPPIEENGTISWALVQKPSGPVFALWNTLTNEWDFIGRRFTSFVGDIAVSFFTEEQFQQVRGDTSWVLADGRNVAGSKWSQITGTAFIPDMRGMFLRGKNNGRDDEFANPDGEVPLASLLNDGIRNIEGQFYSGDNQNNTGNSFHAVEGVFYGLSPGDVYYPDYNGGIRNNFGGIAFDASRVVPTALDNRPKNITVNYFIKINE